MASVKALNARYRTHTSRPMFRTQALPIFLCRLIRGCDTGGHFAHIRRRSQLVGPESLKSQVGEVRAGVMNGFPEKYNIIINGSFF
jgi:hypothetical protein